MERNSIHINVRQIAEHPLNEQYYGATVADETLVKSIELRGILQPLLVVEKGETDGVMTYKLIAGHRRRRAAIAAGMQLVPCEVRQYATPEEEEMDLLASNQQREKTQQQRRAEFRRWKQLLKMAGKNRQGYRSGDDKFKFCGIPQNLNSAEDEPLDTRKIIEQQTGIKRQEQEQLTVVEDDDYLEKQLKKLRRTKPDFSAEAENALFEGWMQVRREFIGNAIALPEAATRVKELLRVASGIAEEGGSKAASSASAKPTKKGTVKNTEKKGAVKAAALLSGDASAILTALRFIDVDMDGVTVSGRFFRAYEEHGCEFGLLSYNGKQSLCMLDSDVAHIFPWETLSVEQSDNYSYSQR